MTEMLRGRMRLREQVDLRRQLLDKAMAPEKLIDMLDAQIKFREQERVARALGKKYVISLCDS